MAESPAHLFGQIIGNLLEEIVKPILLEFCEKHNYYLDFKGYRGTARGGKKVTWVDKYGNSHDLDYVIEKNGSQKKRGQPLAFIEVAWRRYTKHSRNKAQEIQGAILPIAEKHSWDTPFLGAIIAGVFTDNSISQMESVGFKVLYIPYNTIVAAFASEGVEVKFDESTKDIIFKRCVKAIQKLSKAKLERIKSHLVNANKGSIEKFQFFLEQALLKMIDTVIITPLYGKDTAFKDLNAAIEYISKYSSETPARDFKKFEIIIKYTNGDTINASFADKHKAVSFLNYLKW